MSAMDKGINGNKPTAKGSSGTQLKRQTALGVLPEDFVLHRAGKGKTEIVSSRAESEEMKLMDFDIDIGIDDDFDITVPEDDDFDIEVRFD